MKLNNNPEPIAIVGMACRLPGEVTAPSKLWDLLVNEGSAQSDVPHNRFEVDSWYHAEKQRPGSINTRGGYFLGQDDSFRQFDASFFGINPKEAASMDPQQRKLLEVVYESFEAAGDRLQDVSGSNTACYVGNFTWDIGQMQARDVNHGAPYHMTGGGLTILSNRVNYVFNLKGPSMTIDTACSSTMYALHMACRSLQAGDCSAAVVAGTNLIFGIEQQIASVRLGVLSPTSICHTFDESADGYARAEAVGALYLKPLSQAIADKNPVRAVIRATSINANGRSPGISHPSAADQESVIRQAYSTAQLGFEQTGYFECHGTGTPVGDPLEISAIGNVFSDVRTPESPLLVGSVKTNLGHGEAASAISSLIKTVLCLEKGQIPATIGIKQLNPALNLRDGRLKVVQTLSPWPAEQSYLRASVNSFGYGGANAHAILDAVQSYLGGLHETIPEPIDPVAPLAKQRQYYVLPFSAHDKSTLERNIRALSSSLKRDMDLSSLAYTLDSRRSNHSERAYILIDNGVDCARLSNKLVSENMAFGTAMGAQPEVAFVFTGQGAQWAQMGYELVERYELVRKTVQNLSETIASLQNRPQWDLLQELTQPQEKSRINKAELSQPLTTAIQIAMVDLLRSWDVYPTATVGHSSGEIAAAYCTGHITAQEAIIIAYQRGAATVQSTQRGAMLAVGLGPAEVVKAIGDISEVEIACYNAPDSVTLSGSEMSIEEACSRLLAAKIFHRKLQTSGNAYHSKLMNECGQHYETLLKQSLPHKPRSTRSPGITMFSTVTEGPIDTVDIEYWRQNLESPVRFDTTTQQLLESRPEVKVLVEIGPHSALAAPCKAIRKALNFSSERLSYLSALKRNSNSVECLLNFVGSLFLAGYPVPISTVNAASNVDQPPGEFIVDLPTYQWQYDKEVMWAESRLSTDIRFRAFPHHDLLGSRLPGTSNIAPVWRNLIDLDSVPWLKDHKVGDSVVFPAAGYVALAIEAIAQIRGSTTTLAVGAYTLRDVNISSAMLLKENSYTELIVDLHAVPGQHTAHEFVVSTVSNGTWTEHASGSVEVGEDHIAPFRNDSTIPSGRGGVNKDSFDRRWYSAMNRVGLIYGQAFTTLSDIKASVEHCQATADVPFNASEGQMVHQSRYAVHPTTLDACLQLSIIAAHKGKSEDLIKAYLPVTIPRLTVWPSKANEHGFLKAFGRGVRCGLRTIQASTELSTLDDQKFLQAEISFLSLEAALDDANIGKMPQPYTRLIWKPDVDRLTNAQARAVFSPSQADESTAKFYFSSLEKLTQLAICSVVRRLPGDLQVDRMPDHMQKFLEWLIEQNAVVSETDVDGMTSNELVEKVDSIAQSLEQDVPEAAMVAQLNTKMPEIINGTVGALDVMIENDLLTRIYENGFGQTGAYARLTDVMGLMAHKNPRLRIVELGAGTGGATRVMLNALEGETSLPKYEKYDFTDVSKAFLGVAQERFQAHRVLDYGILDIENDPTSQGFEQHSYDVVFASNVIHATRNVASSLRNCHRLLKPEGKLVIVETTKDWLFTGFMLGALPGYWLGANDGRPSSPFLSKARWSQALLDAGFAGIDIVLDDYNEPASCTTLMVARKSGKESHAPPSDTNEVNDSIGMNGSIGVNGTTNLRTSQSVGETAKSSAVTMIYRYEPQPIQGAIEHKYAELGISTRNMALKDVPSFLERDARTIMLAELEGPLLARMTPSEMTAVQRYTQLASTALWVTNGGVMQGRDPEKSLVFGLAKAIMTEQPSFHLCSLDIDTESGDGDEDDSALLVVETETAFHRDPRAEMDTELVERDGLVYISRYVSDYTENAGFERHLAFSSTRTSIGQSNDAFAMEFEKIGKVESFYFERRELKTLADGEVLIDVDATPLSLTTIEALKGKSSSTSFGQEVAGTVRAVSSTAHRLKAGDYVCCIYPHHFDTAIIVDENDCEILPVLEPIGDLLGQIHPLITSLHAANLLRLSQGDQVLIDCQQGHLAYILAQVAFLKSSRVHVTFRSDADSERLQQLGNKAKLIEREATLRQDSSTNLFDAVLTDAKDRFHSLSNTVKPGGRIMVFGSSPPLEMIKAAGSFLKKSVTIGICDPKDSLATASTRQITANSPGASCNASPKPAQLPSPLAEAVDLLHCGIISPVPCEVFDLSRLPEAVSKVAQDGFVGSAILARTPDTLVPVRAATNPLTFNPDVSYFLVGCLGGLGRSLTSWMVSRGARHFIFLSRSGADKPEAALLVEELHELARATYPELSVQVIRGDVSVRDDVARAISCATKPIKGVVQAAMVLKDKLFSEMSLDDFNKVVHPKMLGSINLHELLLNCDLDFFVMTSSVLGAIGAAMQSNYSAANAYLDHMARHRRSMGLQAMSIALGMIVDVGHVEEHPEVEKALKRNGLYGISVDEYLINMELACRRQDLSNATSPQGLFRHDTGAAAHIVTGMDPTRLSRAGGKSLWLKDNRLRNIVLGLGEVAGDDERSIEDATGVKTTELLDSARSEGGPASVKAVVLKLILGRFSKLVLLQAEKIDPDKPLAYYGMDSMISAELKSWAWREFEVDLPFLGLLDQRLTFNLLSDQIVKILDEKTE